MEKNSKKLDDSNYNQSISEFSIWYSVKRIFILSFLLPLSCGYSTRSLLPSHLNTLAITGVENSTTQPGLAEELIIILPFAFNAERNLRISSFEEADLSLSVKITNYSRTAASYDASQNITAYEITMEANFEAFDQIREESFSSGTVTSKVVYNPNEKSEEEAIKEAIKKLAQEIVRQVLTSW